MSDIDLRLIRYFSKVAERRSFSAASSELGVSQPALSQAIRRLEDIVGAPLIIRARKGSTRPLELTPEGESVIKDGRKLLSDARHMLKRARQAGEKLSLKIGFGTSTPRHLTRLVLQKGEDLSQGELHLVFVPWGDEIAALERGDVDVAFHLVQPGRLAEHLEGVALQAVERLAIFHVDHPMAARQQVGLAELDHEPILDAAFDRDFWIANPRPSGCQPIAVGPAARTVDEMLTFVSAGRGMAITSSPVADNNGSVDIRFVPIAGLEPAMVTLSKLRSDGRPPVHSLLQRIARVIGGPRRAPDA